MSDEPANVNAPPASVPEAEMEGWFETANAVLAIANDLIETEMLDHVAGAFLSACARYNAYAMQVMSDGEASPDDGETVPYLGDQLESHLRDHMQETLGSGPMEDTGGRDPETLISLLVYLWNWGEDELDAFFDLADAYIFKANDLAETEKIGRISSTIMHAASRFAVYAMQRFGMPAEEVDDARVKALRDAYETLLRDHMAEDLSSPVD